MASATRGSARRGVRRIQHPSPELARDVEIATEGHPDVARIHTVLDRLSAGAPAEFDQHMIDEQRIRRGTELGLHQLGKLCQTHSRPAYGLAGDRDTVCRTCSTIATGSVNSVADAAARPAAARYVGSLSTRRIASDMASTVTGRTTTPAP